MRHPSFQWSRHSACPGADQVRAPGSRESQPTASHQEEVLYEEWNACLRPIDSLLGICFEKGSASRILGCLDSLPGEAPAHAARLVSLGRGTHDSTIVLINW